MKFSGPWVGVIATVVLLAGCCCLPPSTTTTTTTVGAPSSGASHGTTVGPSYGTKTTAVTTTIKTVTTTTLGTPNDQESCEALGGIWGPIGLNPMDACNLPAMDAGKECSNQDECEGACIAELTDEDWDKALNGVVETKGKCSEWKITVGCQAFVEDGKVDRIICID